MPVSVRLGRKPAVHDPRVPFLADLAGKKTLPAPPAAVNWYADVGAWRPLGNTEVGDCVEAMAGHATLAFTTYAGAPKRPDAQQAIALYSVLTGYKPGDPATDQGTVVMGPGGLMEYWAKTGIVFGGARSKCPAYAQLHIDDTTELEQAIHYFGGIGLGLNLPQSIVSGDTIPFMWSDASGPSAGGHEIWVCGYETEEHGEVVFDFITWGVHCRMTEAFLKATAEEAVAIYDPDSLNARGMNGADFDAAELLGAMQALHAN